MRGRLRWGGLRERVRSAVLAVAGMSQTQKTRGLNPNHNSTLKLIFKGAATTIITKLEGEPLRNDYERLLTQGTKPNLAKLTIARKIAATTLAMWKVRILRSVIA